MATRFHHINIFTFLFLTVMSSAPAQSTHGWRGPERSGSYPETGLLSTWPDEGPELLWTTLDAGKGYSSPVVADGFLYVTGMNEGRSQETFAAYTLEGEKLYQIAYGSPWDNSFPETRTTPTIMGDKAYVISGSGEAVCINIENGDIIWEVDGGALFERKTGKWGTAESPLVVDNKVIYTPGGDQTTMVALHAETGALAWKSRPLGDACSYVSPLLITYNGIKKIIGVTGRNVIGVDPETGHIDWAFDDWGRKEGGRENIATNTPLYHDGRLFFSSGYDMGSFMLELSDNAGDAKLVWRNDGLDTHIGGYVLLDGVIYGSNWINNRQGNWVAVDWNTGETLYEEEWAGGKSKGAIITADGMLYCYDERRGVMGLVKPNPQKFEVISEFQITQGDGPHWAHPVIQDGVLYVRHGPALMAYSVK